MSTSIDEPQKLRDEGAFDVDALHAWLGAQVDGLAAAPPQVPQFAGGASNLTPLHDTRREHRVQAALALPDPYVPAMVALCNDPSVLGTDRQVTGWSDRYRHARTEDVPDFEVVRAWLVERQPADVATCLVRWLAGCRPMTTR